MPPERDYVDVPGLPDGWTCAKFPTIMSGEVLRYYRKDRDDREIVSVSRDGIGVGARYSMFRSRMELDDLLTVIEIASRQADRMARGNWGMWDPGP